MIFSWILATAVGFGLLPGEKDRLADAAEDDKECGGESQWDQVQKD